MEWKISMKWVISKKNALLFISFFLLTVGEGNYVFQHYRYNVEYVGYLFLLVTFALERKSIQNFFLNGLRFTLIMFLFCICLAFQSITITTKVSIALSMFLLTFLTGFSGSIISGNKKIKVVADAILMGCICTGVIGLFTGTLGLSWDPYHSYVGILFYCGFRVKNYCGGIWLLLFMLYYIFYLRLNVLNRIRNRCRLLLITFLMIISGSKGVLVLYIIFVMCINTELIKRMKKAQRKLAILIVVSISLLFSAYMMSEILPDIRTYAYRINGVTAYLNKVMENKKFLLWGLSEIAYQGSGADYATNMRNYFGWDASVEIAYLNILIKNGLLGFVAYILIYSRFIKSIKKRNFQEKQIIVSLIIVALISGFVETYMVTIHIIFGPAIYCLINGLIDYGRTPKVNNGNQVLHY